jgi:hypothetical protein
MTERDQSIHAFTSLRQASKKTIHSTLVDECGMPYLDQLVMCPE